MCVRVSSVTASRSALLSRYGGGHSVYQSREALALSTALGLSVAYVCCGGLCTLGDDMELDAGLVAVEGCDVKHVAVCANPDGLHLAIPRQRGRMGGAAGAEDLK